MSQERLLRRGDEVQAFDWRRSAHDLDVPLDVARGLYLRATRNADPWRAEQLYLRWLRDAAAARAAAPSPVPGRQTLLGGAEAAEAHRARHRSADRRSGRFAPGKWTAVLLAAADDARLPGLDDVSRLMAALASAEAAVEDLASGEQAPLVVPGAPGATRENAGALSASSRDAALAGIVADAASSAEVLRQQLIAAAERGTGAAEALAAADPATAETALHQLRGSQLPGRQVPILRLVSQSTPEAQRTVEQLLGQRSHGAALPSDLADRLGPHIGHAAAGAARLHTDGAAAAVADAHHAHAVTVGTDIYFAPGAFAPGSERGDELIAHELTHVAQAQRGDLFRAAAKGIDSGGTLDATEAEAELRAKLAVIQLHAPATNPPPLASPTGQPTSDGARTAAIAAQQQRLSLAGQPAQPVTDGGAPPPSSPQPAVPHAPPPMAPPKPTEHTGNAYVDTFSAAPSKQAMDLWGKAGTQATTQAAADQAKFTANLQPLPVVLDGHEAPAKGAGSVGGKTPAPPPAQGAAPPTAQPTPTPAAPPVTTGATAAQQVKPSADKAQIKADGQKAIDALPTNAPNINTSPGPAPVTDLAGQADPVRSLGDQQHATGEGAKALDDAKTKVLSGPGAAQVQPAKLDQKLVVPATQAPGQMPTLPAVDGMAKFKTLNLPGDAQAAFDNIAKPKLDARLTEAKSKMTQAEVVRDTSRDKAITDAQTKVKAAHADADKQQQTKVADTRTQIANHQADTLLKQETEVKKLDQQAGAKKTGTISKINARITADQTKVETDYQTAQQKAEDQKKQGEADAAKKKQEAEDKKKNESWWDRAADAVCDEIKSIASEIDKVLDDIGKAIGSLLDAVKDAACKLIDAAKDFVCAALTEFGDWLKSAVTALIGSVFPQLAAELNALIDQAVNAAKAAVTAIADGLKKAVTDLCDGLKAAVDAAIAAFKAAVQVAATFAQAMVTGDWKLVAKMILEGVLKLLGIDPAAFYALIGQVEDSIDKIVADPGAFVGHLVAAVKQGFKQFGANFWTHLKDGVVQWLFGTFAQAGITMPTSFDVAGIFNLVCQVLGLTWDRLRPKVVRVIGEKNTERLEFVTKYIQALVTGGFNGLWQQIQQDMSGLWDMVINGVKQWLIEKVVQQAIIKIATMWNPAGAIIQLIETAWNVYQWVKENAQRIFGLVQAVVDSISNIVAGNIGGAANFIEASLAKLVPVAISLFADLLGLGGIADKIRSIIEKVQDTIDKAIDKLIDKVMGMFKGKGGAAGADGADGKDKSVGEVITFEASGHSHRMWFDVKGASATLMVASDPLPVRSHLDHMKGQVDKLPEDKRASASSLITEAGAAEAKATADATKAVADPGTAKDTADGKAADSDEHTVAGLMKQLFELFEGLNADDLKAACAKAGGMAETKFGQVMGEAQPGAVGVRSSFLAGANVRLKTAPDKPLDAMRDEVASGDKYILKGTPVPMSEIAGSDGISRVLDLPSVFNYYLKPDFKAAHDLKSADDFVALAAAGKFNPSTDLDDSKEIRGKVAESWWFAKAQAAGVTLGQIKKDLTVMDSTYDKGMLRLNISAAEMQAANIQLHKPTAFDGLMQGWGDDPMWVAAPGESWGLTRDGMHEGVIKASSLGAFKTRKLILPEPLPATAAVPKSLVEPAPAKVAAKGPLAKDIQNVKTGQVLFDNGADPKTATTNILNNHKDAHLDTETGAMTLPPVATIDPGKPLNEVAGDIAKQTGVSRVTPVIGTGGEVHLRGAINPEITLASIAPDGSTEERKRAAQALGSIPVAKVGDTYYVKPDDASQMLSLLKVFEPDVQVRDYKKGFVVRYNSSEWYFERNATAQGSGTAGATTPNASTYELHGFRGVRQVNGVAVRHLPPEQKLAVDQLTQQYPLLWAGHVGISVDGGKKIYGFTPDKPPDMDTEDFMRQLRDNQSFPGIAQDDKYIFDLAAKLHATQGWSTEVLVSTQLVTSQQKEQIVEKLEGMAGAGNGAGTGHGARYQFPTVNPGASGSHFDSPETANCAVFPTLVGAQIPEPSGQLKDYIPKLQEWVNESPVDLRGS